MPGNAIDLRDLHLQREDKKLAHRPATGVVASVHPETETVKIESFGAPGTSPVAIRHPYVGKSSWLRCMPETGTSVATQQIRAPKQIEIWGYLSHRLGELVQQYRKNQSILFRQLQPGELEIMSVGRAYQHWSEDGDVTLLGGIVEQHVSQTELEWRSRAPTHRRQLDRHVPIALGYEERFGLVKRPDTQKPNALQVYVKNGLDFQYEYGRWLLDDQDKVITTLHEGHLYDVQQQPIKNQQTDRAVRLRRTVEHQKNGTLTFDVDQDLNILLTNTSKAETTNLDFGLKNEIKITAKKLDFSILKSSNQTFASSVTLKAPKMRFNGTDVGFGAAPFQPAVLGTTLVTNVLVPLITSIQSAFTILAADPVLAVPTQQTLSGLVTGMAAISTAASSVLSTEVKLTK